MLVIIGRGGPGIVEGIRLNAVEYLFWDILCKWHLQRKRKVPCFNRHVSLVQSRICMSETIILTQCSDKGAGQE